MKFDQFLRDNKNSIIDIYFDMDGVFAEYDIGNFDYSTIRPIKSVINIMNNLKHDGMNIKVLSICKNNRIVDEKYDWIEKYVPFLDKNDLIFLSKEENEGIESNELKSNYLRDNTNNNHISILIDDDSQVIKKVVKDNENVKVFHISSIIK